MSREIGKHPALGAAYGRDDSLDDVQPEGPHGSDKYRPGDFVGGYGDREPFIGVLASLAAAISLLERIPNAKKAAPSDMMFEQMLTDYRRALEIGRSALRPMSDHRERMREIGPLTDPVREMLRRMIAEFGDEHYHTCPADNDSGPCDCFAGHLLNDARRTLDEALTMPPADRASPLSSTSQNTPEAANAPAVSTGGELAQVVPDPDMTPKRFLDDILSACDASNWDADLNTGAYYRGLKDAYEAIQFIAIEYQTSIYAWNRASA